MKYEGEAEAPIAKTPFICDLQAQELM